MCDLSQPVAFRLTGGLEDIPGADGLRGAASHGFVTIVGSCGDYHTLSKAAAAGLFRWLGSKLCTVPPYTGRQEARPVVGEWISEALAKERAHA